MITLPFSHHNQEHLLTILKKSNCNQWNIYIGTWCEHRKSLSHLRNTEALKAHNKCTGDSMELETKTPIIMNAKDLTNFAKEIRKILHTKPYKREPLNLTFRRNKPQFRILVRYITDDAQLSSSPRSDESSVYVQLKPVERKNKYEFKPQIVIDSSVVSYERPNEDLSYLRGTFIGGPHYYPPSVLGQFAADLEREAAPYLAKKWWEFWK